MLLMMAIGDLLVDLGDGQSTDHLFWEGSLMAALIVLAIFCGARFFSAGKEKKRGGLCYRFINGICCLLSVSFLISLTGDDVLSMIEGAGETSGYLGAVTLNNNFHEVVPGRFYRAGEMPHRVLEGIVREYGIKTIIDLRWGEDDSDPSGRTEGDVARDLNVHYVHHRFRSAKIPKYEQVTALLESYDRAELPLLVHCSSGTHRTGFAAAIWLLDKEQYSRQAALEQFSPRYGFFRFERRVRAFLQDAPTLDSLVWRFAAEAKSKQSIRDWLREDLATKDQSHYSK